MKSSWNDQAKSNLKFKSEVGSALVITLLILTLLIGFVALAVTRTASETIASSNDATETLTFEAAHASLEIMTRNFDKIYDVRLNPIKPPAANNDIDPIINTKPEGFLADFDFTQNITQTKDTETVVLTGQFMQGLYALRDEWQIDSVATDKKTGVQVALQRKLFNNRVPLFQFGVFYNNDLYANPTPIFNFGGRVHSNESIYPFGTTGLYFSSKVTAAEHIITDVLPNGVILATDDQTYIKNASGTNVRLRNFMGSAIKQTVNGSPVFSNPNKPTVYKNANWNTHKESFQGNLLSEQPRLDLPLKVAQTGNTLDYVELIRRGKSVGDLYNNGTGTVSAPNIVAVTATTADDTITAHERFANKKGIRISLSDSKARLPGCATATGGAVTTTCGIRLDGNSSGDGSYTSGQPRGYQPMAMADGYQATRLNGERFAISGREVWIKVELVDLDVVNDTIVTQDITADILSLGITEAAPCISGKLWIQNPSNYCSSGIDTRSIIKLQRFAMPGVALTASDTNYLTNYAWTPTAYNLILSDEKITTSSTWTAVDNGTALNFTGDNVAHKKLAIVNDTTKDRRIVPFPIQIFDPREGLYNLGVTLSTTYGTDVPWAGVMSLVDIDVANLRQFLMGNRDSVMPVTGTVYTATTGHKLRASDVPQDRGWVVYISDRRGDYDFDGAYDMEDLYGNNDGVLQPGEDLNRDGVLQRDFTNEAVRYTGTGTKASPAIAATIDHPYYRRAVRLINGTLPPGIYDASNPNNTRGFTFASENGIYVLGNYNSTGISSVGTPSPSTAYQPQNGANHIPSAIIGDAVTVLSNNWQDSRSFRYPFTPASKPGTETTIRFALLSGLAMNAPNGSPNQGGSVIRLSGGLNNHKRTLESWGSNRLNYCGSIVNLFLSQNSNGTYKFSFSGNNYVFSAPVRNWVFDSTFLDANRLPPGTPYIQNIQLTGFQRLN